MQSRTDKPAPGLYVHVPFCRQKCPYCDFYSVEDMQLVPGWLDALAREMALYREHFTGFDTLYLGGGTPTAMAPGDIEKLLGLVRKHFCLVPGAEVTIEANPSDVTPGTARELLGMGFNRVSLGVQSFDDGVLRFLNRRHTAAEARQAAGLLREAGFTNLSMDLMYAVPGQSMHSWQDTLGQALAFGPEHLSCYQLTVKAGTPLWRLVSRGGAAAPGPVREEAFFRRTVDVLHDSGFQQYELSSFARSPAWYSAHNRKYWRHIDYLGLGPAAHSLRDRTRWWNCRSVTGYTGALSGGALPREGREAITDEQFALEELFLRFRTREGIALDTLRSCKNTDRVLPGLLSSQVLEIIGDRVVPTTRGLLVADSLPLLFV